MTIPGYPKFPMAARPMADDSMTAAPGNPCFRTESKMKIH